MQQIVNKITVFYMIYDARGASACTVSGSKTDEKLFYVVLNEIKANQGIVVYLQFLSML